MIKQRMLIISFSNISKDARVLKQVTLFADQYELFTCGHGPAPVGVAGHYEISEDRQAWQYDRASLILRRFRKAYWTNPAVVAAVALLPQGAFDAILANDVDSVGVALSLKPERGVHADLHEYAPRQKEELTKWRWFVAPFIRWMCRQFVARADSVTTVGQGIALEYARVYGFTPAVVTNAAPYAELAPGQTSQPIRLVHSGACLRGRGIGEIIDAVERATTNLRLDLYLTPNDPGYLKELETRMATSSRCSLHAPVPYADLVGTLNSFDVGVHLLPPVNFNNAWALPNKFFDYVQARLGIVIGPSPEMAQILRERGLGAVAEAFTADALVVAFENLTPEIVATWKQASHAAARELSSESQVLGWDRAMRALLA